MSHSDPKSPVSPIRIPLSSIQCLRLATLATEAQHFLDLRNEAIATLIAGACDPAAVEAWTVTLTPDAILLAAPGLQTDLTTSGPTLTL